MGSKRNTNVGKKKEKENLIFGPSHCKKLIQKMVLDMGTNNKLR